MTQTGLECVALLIRQLSAVLFPRKRVCFTLSIATPIPPHVHSLSVLLLLTTFPFPALVFLVTGLRFNGRFSGS